MNELILKSNVVPASFVDASNKNNIQIDLIVSLLKDSVKKKTPITIEMIQDIYAEYAMQARRHRTGYVSTYEKGSFAGYYYFKTKDDWIKHHCTPFRAKQWFKNNLGAAILKGKVLAIPVIEIE